MYGWYRYSYYDEWDDGFDFDDIFDEENDPEKYVQKMIEREAHDLLELLGTQIFYWSDSF